MTDCFALLGAPRRPWLDPDALKEKFHRLSAVHHPDVAKDAGADFTGINAAYQTLYDPKTRIRHLLELEFPGALSRTLQIPPDITRLFETMTRERHGVAAFLEKRATLQSPLENALAAPEKLEFLRVLERLLEVLTQKQEGIFTQLQFVDAVWGQDKAGSLERRPARNLPGPFLCGKMARASAGRFDAPGGKLEAFRAFWCLLCRFQQLCCIKTCLCSCLDNRDFDFNNRYPVPLPDSS